MKTYGLIRHALACVFLMGIASTTPADAAVQGWNIVMAKSQVKLTFTQMKTPVTATLERFKADIQLDPDHLQDSRIQATIDVTSFATDDKDRDDSAQTKDWFDSQNFPAATFQSTSIKKVAGDRLEALGNLTIKGVSLPVTLPFTLHITKTDSGNKKAEAEAEITLDRSKFKLGEGEWADASVIANDVKVEIHLTAFAK